MYDDSWDSLCVCDIIWMRLNWKGGDGERGDEESEPVLSNVVVESQL